MKVVILAGGMGTRLGPLTKLKPKPMVKVLNLPIICYIIKIYNYYGFKDIFIALGYKGNIIRKYFEKNKNYNSFYFKSSNQYFKIKKTLEINHNKSLNKPNIFLFETGLNTMTGGRLKKFEKILGNENFMLTYGDGLSDINLKKLIHFHKKNNTTCTVTAVRPIPRFGALEINNNLVKNFSEKSILKEGWINGGFFIFEPKIFKYLKNNKTYLERDPMANLSKKSQLTAYKHRGFWYCMDNLRDKIEMEKILKRKKYKWLKKY